MTRITHQGNPVDTQGELPAVGTKLPDFELVGLDLETFSKSDLGTTKLVLNIFPSIDTGVCATSVRTFNERASGLEGTKVVCISRDLPFAQARFCGAEGIENVVMGSDYRGKLGEDYGVTQLNGKLQGLLSRAVIVADEDGTILYTEQVPEIGQEPNYEAALAALK